MIAPYLASPLVNLFKPENKNKFTRTEDLNSTKTNDFLMNTSVQITLYRDMLTFRDTNRSLKLDGNLLKPITNYGFNVDHSNWQDPKQLTEFGKEMKVINEQKDKKVLKTNFL